MNSKISDKDKKDWENFLSKNENLPDKDSNLAERNIKKIISFDFHGYSLEDANKKIKDLIYNSYNKKISRLIIVTGKGLHSENDKNPYVSKDLGILKYSTVLARAKEFGGIIHSFPIFVTKLSFLNTFGSTIPEFTLVKILNSLETLAS